MTMGLFDMFWYNKTSLRLNPPKAVVSIQTVGKVKFIGTTRDIEKLVEEIRKIPLLKDGQLARLHSYTLKVSECMTEDRFRENWVELPAQAWAVMASKFLEVTERREENPFSFNSCGYTEKTPLDIGVEVSDLHTQSE